MPRMPLSSGDRAAFVPTRMGIFARIEVERHFAADEERTGEKLAVLAKLRDADRWESEDDDCRCEIKEHDQDRKKTAMRGTIVALTRNERTSKTPSKSQAKLDCRCTICSSPANVMDLHRVQEIVVALRIGFPIG